ncbi:hypothetical protein [Halobacteriovorax marinus]|nr:hypothetical protein [Halobacteriovorax marinus]
MKLDQRGSTQLLLCLFLLMALSGISAITVKKLIYLHKNRLRLHSLICMRKSHFFQAKFINQINSTNKHIRISYYASLLPIPSVSSAAKTSLTILKAKQQINLISFYRDIYKVEECSKVTKINIFSSSFYQLKSKFIFMRNIDHTTRVSIKKQVKFRYFTSGKLSFKTPPVIFKSSFKLDNRFDIRPKVFTKVYEL